MHVRDISLRNNTDNTDGFFSPHFPQMRILFAHFNKNILSDYSPKANTDDRHCAVCTDRNNRKIWRKIRFFLLQIVKMGE